MPTVLGQSLYSHRSGFGLVGSDMRASRSSSSAGRGCECFFLYTTHLLQITSEAFGRAGSAYCQWCRLNAGSLSGGITLPQLTHSAPDLIPKSFHPYSNGHVRLRPLGCSSGRSHVDRMFWISSYKASLRYMEL
jgi:hypothetical protein